MWRTVLTYGVVLAAGALGLRWLEYRLLMHAHPVEAYFGIFAVACMGLGAWVALRVRGRPDPGPYRFNRQAQESLGVSEREIEVLALIAAGHSNKDIARRLAVSPNTVKTHVSNLFEKLHVQRRTEAIARARELRLIR